MKRNKSEPHFGQKIKGATYIVRPGAYAIIFDAQNYVGLIQVGEGYFLPGGGIDAGEAVQDALCREVVEECGYELLVGAFLGTAVEYIMAQSDGIYYEIQSAFWQARLGQKIGEPSELDHQLVWCDVATALTLLTREGQRWALQKAAGIGDLQL